MTKQLVLVAVATHLMMACGGDADGDAGIDGGMIDASDAGDATPDAGPPEMDSGPLDTDEDGTPDDVDCDPADAAVGATGSRSCDNACGAGTETCTDGVWAGCDAPTDCLCDTEGANRVADCGNCGMQSEQCTGGVWVAQSMCLNQGECAPATVEMRTTDYCQVDQRLCSSECAWNDWSTIVPAGECRAGSMGSCRMGVPQSDFICTSDCRRLDDPACPWGPGS